MSAQIFRIQNNEAKVEVNVFNEYVNPGRKVFIGFDLQTGVG